MVGEDHGFTNGEDDRSDDRDRSRRDGVGFGQPVLLARTFSRNAHGNEEQQQFGNPETNGLHKEGNQSCRV